jgi:transcriptional regulator with XRE-family HTH domain
MLTVGDRVRRRRLELGWSQGILSKKAGISKSFLSDLENNRRSVGAETLLDLCRAMRLSMDYVMTGKESSDPEPDARIPGALARFASEEGLSVRETLTLLEIQERLMASRRKPKTRQEKVNWEELYRTVKRFLGDEE